MSRLANISGKEAVRVFLKAGYIIQRQTASHIILYSPQPGRPMLSIPDHRELAPNLLRDQIKQAGLTIEEFLSMRKG